MEQRLSNAWRMTVNEKKFIEAALLSDLRIDGRGPFDYRNVTVQFGSEDGSSEVQLGKTRVAGFVTAELVQPYRDRPNEGTLAIFTEFSPMADPSFEVGRPGEFAVELWRIIDRGLRETLAVDMEELCVISGKYVWSIRIDLHILDNCGNLIDAANIAALAALLTFRRPVCTLGGENGQEVTIHPPHVKQPLPLTVYHLPIAVTFAFIGEESRVIIDPSNLEEDVMGGRLTATVNRNGDICAIQKVGEGVIHCVIMQCLRIASTKAVDLTDKIKKAVELYNTAKSLKAIKRRSESITVNPDEMINLKLEIDNDSISQHGMEINSHSTEKDGRVLEDKKPEGFMGGPSSWDPYSKGINSDELKASVISQAMAAPEKKIDASKPVTSPSVEGAGPEASPYDSDGPEEAMSNDAKSLKDAVKSKRRKKKKKQSNNSDGR